MKQLKIAAIFLGMLLLWPWPAVGAQSASPTLENLMVEIWPEYDRPEALVIYRIELDENVSLPTTLTFRLPGHVERMHAVAYQQDGGLFAVAPDQVEISQQGEFSLVTFPAPSHQLQLEYYDPLVLSKEGENRELNYNFVAPYGIEALSLVVRSPLESENYNQTPAPTRNFTDGEGFTSYEFASQNVAAGETFEIRATYSRPTDEVSTALLELAPEHAADVFVTLDPEADSNLTLAYWLIGFGLFLLLVSGGSYLWSRRARLAGSAGRAPVRRPGQRRKREKSHPQPPKETAPPRPPSKSGFCYRCGTALRPEGNFCHACGAERRQE